MKTSFNGLKVSVEGVYSAYNLTPEELESLRRHFRDKVNGSNGNYTVYENANRRVILQLFVHEAWKLIEFDLRRDLLKLFKSDRIFTSDIEKLSKKLKEMRIEIHVDYNWHDNTWSIVDYDKFLELLAKLIAEL